MTDLLILLGAAIAFTLTFLLINLRTSRYANALKFVSYSLIWLGICATVGAMGALVLEVLQGHG